MKTGEIREVAGVTVVRGADGLFRDAHGTVYGLAEDSWSLDSDTRLGVGPFSLNNDDVLNDSARAHDFAFSCPAFQVNHGRSEADDRLKDQLDLLAGKSPVQRAKAWGLARLARLFGFAFWERDSTRWK